MKSDVSITFSQKSSAGCYPHYMKLARNTIPYFCNIHYTILLPSNAQLLKFVSSHQVLKLPYVFSYHENATSFQIPKLTSKISIFFLLSLIIIIIIIIINIKDWTL